MFGIGPNNLWLGLHGLLMVLFLISTAFLFGAVFFAKEPNERLVLYLKISSVVTFVLLMILMITGIIPDLSFGSEATFTIKNFNNGVGTFSTAVTPDNLNNFTGPLLFDMMEHITLVVPGLMAVVMFLVLYYGGQVITNPTIKRSVLCIIFVVGAWTFVLGNIGLYLSRILTFPVGS